MRLGPPFPQAHLARVLASILSFVRCPASFKPLCWTTTQPSVPWSRPT